MARAGSLICVCFGIALAVWLLPASIHIVDWTAEGPSRVALLAPAWQLWAALAIATLAAWAIAASPLAGRLTPFAPLAMMWLWTIPYLPWLPDRAPALLVLAGPLRWAVFGLAVFGCATAVLSSRFRSAVVALPGRRSAFTLSLAVYLFFGLWSATAVGPGADEPHYLVITQSLLRDHDLAIENNHARGDYREYFGGELRPDFLRRGVNEVIYSIHAPGLPALLVPAYAMAGYRGAVAMLCASGALTALAVFDLAMLLAGARVAWMTWAAVCLTVPFVPHSWLIYPEMPGALLMAWAAVWLYAPLPPRARIWVWRGAALAILPWLHTKFVILLAAMLATLVLRLWRAPKAAVALVIPAIVSMALWILSFHLLYGALDPQIPYGDFPKVYVLAANIPRGVLGLLFDQKFGLLMYAPVYAIAIGGCWKMLGRPEIRWFGIWLLATLVVFVASSTRMYMWWGGSSAPARFLVPILPLAGPMIAVAFQSARTATARAIPVLLLIVSLAIAFAGVISPQRFMLFSAPHGLANMAAAAQGPSPLSYLLPTFTEGGLRAPLALLAPWAAAGVVAMLLVVMVSRSRSVPSSTSALAGATAFIVAGAVFAGAPMAPSQQRATVQRGRFELMRAYDGAALHGFDYTTRASIGEPGLFALSAVHLSRAAGELSADPSHFAGPFDLPAGRFTTRITFGGVRPIDDAASISVLFGERTLVVRGQASSAAPVAFDLPVDATVRLTVSDEALAGDAQQVDIVAESIVPRRERPVVDVRAIEAIAGRPGAFIIYADDETYPEGGVFWTRSTHAGRVLIAPAGASTLALTLHVGPVGGLVRVAVDGQDRAATLLPDQTMKLDIPLASTAQLVNVVIQAAGRFRPSDRDPHSTDERWLGCQVRVELQ